jgi:hypothetical protein
MPAIQTGRTARRASYSNNPISIANARELGWQEKRTETIQRHSLKANGIVKAARSALAPETDPFGPLRLIGELTVLDPERSSRILAAFLSVFNGHPSPF